MELKLTKEEIERIIADRFKVPVEDVRATTEETWKGYGTAEHPEHEPIVRVTKPLEEIQV